MINTTVSQKLVVHVIIFKSSSLLITIIFQLENIEIIVFVSELPLPIKQFSLLNQEIGNRCIKPMTVPFLFLQLRICQKLANTAIGKGNVNQG
jgi:hypothetical protein